MDEEEKKAIKDMNKFANSIDTSCVTARQMQIILNLIKKLQKENELAKQALIKNCNIADERNQLLKENAELRNLIAYKNG